MKQPQYSVRYVQAVKSLRRMRGGSQSTLIEGSDGLLYVAKQSGNPQGPNILANELLGALLGRAVSLPVAEPVLIYISPQMIEDEQLIFSTPEGRSKASHGIHFASRLVEDPTGKHRAFDYLRDAEIMNLSNRQTYLGMYIFDLWANHQDRRQAVFLRTGDTPILQGTFIDNGHLFGGPRWDGPECKLLATFDEKLLYSGLWSDRAIKSWIALLQDRLPKAFSAVAPTVPHNWYAGDIHDLEVVMLSRLKNLSEIVEAHSGERNLFPVGLGPNGALRI